MLRVVNFINTVLRMRETVIMIKFIKLGEVVLAIMLDKICQIDK